MIEFSIVWALKPKYWKLGVAYEFVSSIPENESYASSIAILWLLPIALQITTYARVEEN